MSSAEENSVFRKEKELDDYEDDTEEGPEETRLGDEGDEDEGDTSAYIPTTMNEEFLAAQDIKARSFRASSDVVGQIEEDGDNAPTPGGPVADTVAEAGESQTRHPGATEVPGSAEEQEGSTGTSPQFVATGTEQSEVVPIVPTQPEPSTEAAAATAVEAHLVVDVEPPPVYDAQPLSETRLRIQNVQFDSDMGDEENGGGGGESSVASSKQFLFRRSQIFLGLLIAVIVGVAVGVSVGVRSGGESKDDTNTATQQDYDHCARSSECVSGACGLNSFDRDEVSEFVCCPSGKTEVWLLGQVPRSFCARHLPVGASCPDATSPSQELCRDGSCQDGSCQDGTCPSIDSEDPTSTQNEQTVAPTDSPVLPTVSPEGEPETPPAIVELIPCSVPTDCDTRACGLFYYHPANQTYCCPNEGTTTLDGQYEVDGQDGGAVYCKNTIPLFSPCPSEIENSDWLCDSWQCIWEECVYERLYDGDLCQKKSDCFSQQCRDGKCVS